MVFIYDTMATRLCPASSRSILNKYIIIFIHEKSPAHEKSTKLKITIIAGCAEQRDVVNESDEEIKRVFRY